MNIEPEELCDGVTLYEGDCLDVLRSLPNASVDAVITDPPYGIGVGGEWGSSNKGKVKDYGRQEWDNKPCSAEIVSEMRRVSRWQIIFGGNYFALPPSRCWLVWDKLNSGDFADCELAWTNLPKAVRRIQHRWNGMIREGNEERFHPTQKPLKVMKWCIDQLPAGCETILDPFAGSGTTGVAALTKGKKVILIEKDAAYCEVIRRRVREAAGVGSLFEGVS